MSKIPMLDADDPNFVKKLVFELDAIEGSTSWDNARDRPYNGQSHTDSGRRGSQKVHDVTMRDLSDCIVQGFLAASGIEELQRSVFPIYAEDKGWEKGTWRKNDVYKVDLAQVDPVAVIQCALCFVESYMGIFPNVPELAAKGDKS